MNLIELIPKFIAFTSPFDRGVIKIAKTKLSYRYESQNQRLLSVNPFPSFHDVTPSCACVFPDPRHRPLSSANSLRCDKTIDSKNKMLPQRCKSQFLKQACCGRLPMR